MDALIQQLMNEWALFKADNDKRLKEVEAKGRADPLTEEKVNKHSVAIGELQAQIDEVQKKAQRKGGPGDDDKLTGAKAEHRKGFLVWARRGAGEDELRKLQAAVSIDSDPAGGYLVPETLDTVIEKFERDNTPMRQLCKVMTVSNENYKKLIKSGDPSSGWVGEQEARPETTTPTWAELTPFFGEIYSKPKLTQKSLDDAMIDLEAELGEDVGLEFAEQENDAFTRGDGTKKPKGILGYTMSTSVDGTRTLGQVQKIQSGSSGNFVGDKLIDVVHALKRGYRQNAVWQISALGVAAARKLKDGQNNYLWQPNYQVNTPAGLLGYPIEENDDVPVPAADALAAMFGDFRRAYTIVDVKGVRMLRDPYTDKPYVVFYTTKRTGGFLVNDRAVKVLQLT